VQLAPRSRAYDPGARTGDAPLVSVIMNGFNSARYLAEAIDSVLAQTCARWEIVFWDNRSDDDTERIVRGYADERIRFFVAPYRMTLAEGRNGAIAQARGAWFAFLDCDDVWLPFKLERQLARAAAGDAADVGLVYARTLSFTSEGDQGETTYRYAGRPLPEGNLLRPLLLEGNLVPMVSAMVSREACEAVGAIPAHLTFAEDYWLFVAIAERFRVLCVQDVCCRYRVHEGAATVRNKLASHVESLGILEQWGASLAPRELAARRAVYRTLIGIERVRSQRRILAGLTEIVLHGSLPFLLRGSCAFLWRVLIRRQRPYA
jgi:glycosyltransferase involved in cell wall biosynthesis